MTRAKTRIEGMVLVEETKLKLDNVMISTEETSRSGMQKYSKERKELTFLSTAEQRAVLFEREIHINEVGTRKQLHDHSRSDDGGDSEFHKSSTVGSQDDTHPV